MRWSRPWDRPWRRSHQVARLRRGQAGNSEAERPPQCATGYHRYARYRSAHPAEPSAHPSSAPSAPALPAVTSAATPPPHAPAGQAWRRYTHPAPHPSEQRRQRGRACGSHTRASGLGSPGGRRRCARSSPPAPPGRPAHRGPARRHPCIRHGQQPAPPARAEVRSGSWARGWLRLDPNAADPAALHPDHLKPPAAEHDPVPRPRQPAQQRQQQAAQRVVTPLGR